MVPDPQWSVPPGKVTGAGFIGLVTVSSPRFGHINGPSLGGRRVNSKLCPSPTEIGPARRDRCSGVN